MRFQNESVAKFYGQRSPDGWQVVPAKRFCREVDQRSSTGEEELLGLSKATGVRRKSDMDQRASEAENYAGYKRVTKGDLISNKMQAWNGMFGISPYDGITSPDYAIYRLKSTVNHRFIEYVCRTDLYAKEFHAKSRGMGTGFLRLNQSEFLSTPFILPDLATQRQIADFLDRETARIDLLIEKKQRFASGVEDEFLDRVSHLVTLGAHKDSPQKQSGYAWHPSIPAHWTVTRLKFLCSRIVDCLHETPEHIEDGEYPSIRTSDLIRGSVDIGSAKRVSEEEYRHRIQRLEPKEGDILYTREGERFGLAALVPPEIKLCLGQRMMMFRTNRRVLPAYLMWSLNGKFAYNFLKQDVTGATSPHLNIFDIRNVPVFLPPIDEQQALVTEIDAFFEKKSQLVEKTIATIDRLKEYRSALITAAVTGQIDVTTYAKSGTPDRRLHAIQEEMGA
jgi:type I restriction enzyme S subunit